MRASDLIGLEVLDRAGTRLGVVVDLRCVQDGPPRGTLATLRVDALIVAARHAGTMLGYGRPEQKAPWLIAAVVALLHRPVRVIPWSAVADHTGQISLHIDAHELAADQLGGAGHG
jgi:PRC-barrel domain